MKDISETDIQAIKDWLGAGSINIFGLPFSGKDTHGKWLSELFGATLVGGGDILRNSSIPNSVRDIMHAGGLIPTEDYLHIVLPYLSRKEFQLKPMVLSSVGRWHGEEDGVIEATNHSGHAIKAVIYLHIDMQTANERFNHAMNKGDRGDRNDDDKEKLIVRFSEFAEKTLPVIDYYAQRNLLIEVDGNPPVDEVRANILSGLLALSRR